MITKNGVAIECYSVFYVPKRAYFIRFFTQEQMRSAVPSIPSVEELIAIS